MHTVPVLPEDSNLRLLVLTEGPPRSFDSWSGISQNVIKHLEAQGHTVYAADCDLYGPSRLLGAILAFRPNKRRWRTTFRLGTLPFLLRSARARAHVFSYADQFDAILQFGATFSIPPHIDVPIFFYCDGNISLSLAGVSGGNADANFLTTRQIHRIFSRESVAYSRASHIFCFSDRLRRSFIEDFSIPSARVSTVFAGSNFDASVALPNLPLRRSSPPAVLFVGRDFLRKGGDTLVSSFDVVHDHIPDAELYIIGPRDFPDDFHRPWIRFLGHLDRDVPEDFSQLTDAFQRSHIFCLPSRFEGLNISVLEAMLFALPCISASTPWAPAEMVIDGETGYLVSVDDPTELAQRIVRLLSEPETAELMGSKGRARAEAHFTWDRVTERITETMAAHLR